MDATECKVEVNSGKACLICTLNSDPLPRTIFQLQTWTIDWFLSTFLAALLLFFPMFYVPSEYKQQEMIIDEVQNHSLWRFLTLL